MLKNHFPNAKLFSIRRKQVKVLCGNAAVKCMGASRFCERSKLIDSVNSIAAAWDKDQTYWAFYINGEYAATGIDGTEITAGTTYGLTLTKG